VTWITIPLKIMGRLSDSDYIKYMIPLKFGFVTFDHFIYPTISSYLLHNRAAETSKREIEKMFSSTYSNLSEINL
jgi:hypothetical protein